MTLLCLLGRHNPSQASMKRGKAGGYEALCSDCGRPLERGDTGSWRPSLPLYDRIR